MTTDKNRASLATVKHGGCVQLQTSERERFEAFLRDNPFMALMAGTAWQVWQAALSAQPSPGGQNALADAARRVLSDVDSGDYHGEISEATYAALEAALAARQAVGQPAIWVSPGQLAAHKDRVPGDGGAYLPARLTRDGQFTKPLYAAPPAQAVDLERARNEGHDGAIRYVLGYLCGMGDWGSTQYVEILNGCGRESVIRSAIDDGELEFTGLGRWVAERGTDEERALIASQAVGK